MVILYNRILGWLGGVDTVKPNASLASRPLCVLCRVRPDHRGKSMPDNKPDAALSHI
jgi:hypothetical protein